MSEQGHETREQDHETEDGLFHGNVGEQQYKAEEPADKLTDKSTDELTDEPVDGPIDKPTDESSEVKEVIKQGESPILLELREMMERLLGDFQTKLKYDQAKQAIIDKLDAEVQEYRQNLIRKIVVNVFNDVIAEIDDAEKMIRYYEENQPSEENYFRLLKVFREIADNLCLMMEKHDTLSFQCNEGDPFDPSRQRVMKTVPTDNPELDKTVRAKLRRGFEYEGKVIRPEMVEVYIYQKTGGR